MITSGIVLRAAEAKAQAQAVSLGIGVLVSDSWEQPWPRTLFVAPGTEIPWDLLRHGFGLLASWHAAAPLAGKPASALGSPGDRERTRVVVRDLRMPSYVHELLFVGHGGGAELVQAWRAECDGGDEGLAFLRAWYETKPLFCALPNVWLYAAKRQQSTALNTIRPARRLAPRLLPPRNASNPFRVVPGRGNR